MTSRYFFRTFRRLFLLSTTQISFSFRNHRLFWTSLGTATALSTILPPVLPFKQFTNSFISHAKALEKDLSPTGKTDLGHSFEELLSVHRKATFSSGS